MAEGEGWTKWQAVREARAQIEAIEDAIGWDSVVAFRSNHLPDGLLVDERSFHRWLARGRNEVERRSREMLAGSDAVFPEPEDFGIQATPPALSASTEAETLDEHSVQGTSFEELRRLAAKLSDWFGWTPESAAGWVLTGHLPKTHGITVKRLPEGGDSTSKRWSTVVITTPVEVPPSIVAQRYAKAREEILASVPPLPSNPIGQKALRACIFAIQRNDGRSWESVFDEWSDWIAEQGDDGSFAFGSFKNFAFTVRQTYERITGRKLDWQRSRGERRR